MQRLQLALFWLGILCSGAVVPNCLNAQTPISVNLATWDNDCGVMNHISHSPEEGVEGEGGRHWQFNFYRQEPYCDGDTIGYWIWAVIYCDGRAEVHMGANVPTGVANCMWDSFACHPVRDATGWSGWQTGAGGGRFKAVPAGTFNLNHNACETCDDEADADGDGINDCDDQDDDGDGIPDEDDETPNEPDPYNPDSCIMDTDGDGIPNCTDTDDDGDGVPDSDDSDDGCNMCRQQGSCYGVGPEYDPCVCGPADPAYNLCDCVADDPSCDEDGGDGEEFVPDCDASDKTTDSDSDGCPNFRDAQPDDSQGNGGCPPCDDPFEPDCSASDKTTDSDGDGCPNYQDSKPNDSGVYGACPDCPDDEWEPDCDATDLTTDTDEDGCPNYRDQEPDNSRADGGCPECGAEECEDCGDCDFNLKDFQDQVKAKVQNKFPILSKRVLEQYHNNIIVWSFNVPIGPNSGCLIQWYPESGFVVCGNTYFAELYQSMRIVIIGFQTAFATFFVGLIIVRDLLR